ncbi:MAG: hypothetical protein V1904_12590 [Bacteroidota bacterium]
MKKLLLITAALILIGLALSSCKTHERCPAYPMKAKTERPA